MHGNAEAYLLPRDTHQIHNSRKQTNISNQF